MCLCVFLYINFCVCVCLCTCVCVCVYLCVKRGTLLLRQSPLTLVFLPPPTPPTRCRGMMPHPPGSVLSSCRMLLLFPLCLPKWVAGCLADWVNKWARARVFLCSLQTPCPSCLPPTHSKLVVPASTPKSTNQATACLLIMWYPSDSQRALMESPCRAASWLDNRILFNEDDGNDFTLPSPSDASWILNFFF